MKPLVSILIPAHNAQEWIAETIRSALAQTWPNTEIFVLDDGSTDQTLSEAQRFASASVQVKTQENRGAASTRNTLFSLCQGDYIQWLDADDLLATDKVARQIAALNDSQGVKTMLSGAWGHFWYRHAHANFVPTLLWCDLSPVEFLLRKLGQNLSMQTATWLVSRQLTEAAGPWNESLSVDDDGEYFCRALLQSDGVRFVPDARVFYRRTGHTRLSYIGRSRSKADSQWHSLQLQIGCLRALEDNERVRTACVRYLQNWLMDFYPERPDIVSQARQLATELGGCLTTPPFSWKYAWVDTLFGPHAASRVRSLSRETKESALRSWDRILGAIELLAVRVLHGQSLPRQ